MPKYVNNYSNPVYFNNTVFIPNQEISTYDTIDNRAFIIGSISETFHIDAGVNDKLYIKFNEETSWTEITLTAGAAQTATDIANDISAIYSGVAIGEGGKVKITAPVDNNTVSAIYIATTNDTASSTLGFSTDDVNPLSCIALRAFKISSNSETYNITSSNNIFIFKANDFPNWITATLTIGAAQTAIDIVKDINNAYEVATADSNKIAFEVTIDGAKYIKLIAPLFNNFQSRLYIKSTLNTALVVLGFSGDNFDPIVKSFYPNLIKTSELPLYNPMIGETTISFSAAGEKHYYLIDPNECRMIQLVRVSGGGGISFSVYLENSLNLPPFTLVALEALTINLEKVNITKLVIVSNGIGSLTVRELKS